jgi:galactose mutarotase-like enzyme
MYFSIGGHPAFGVPLVPGTDYTDYYLEFDGVETAPRWPISKDGLIGREPLPLLQNTAVLPLRKELFAKDALVIKSLVSTGITLRSGQSERGLRMDFPGFPFLGIWAAPNADFVCIEPWCGIADSVDSNQQWIEKEGINKLEGGSVFERTWTLRLL